jgi:solute carrier family 35 protein F5
MYTHTPSFALGVFYILCIVVNWTFGSVLVQHVFLDLKFDGPFILTYLCSTLFSIYLLVYYGKKYACGSNKPDANNPKYTTLPIPSLSSADEVDSIQDMATPLFSFHKTLYACLTVMPIWFVANWSYNMSLEYTSVTSNTVISNTSSLFTFSFSILILGERWSWPKFLSLMLCFLGAVVVSYADSAATAGSSTAWGDALCLLAAMGYGMYSTVLQLRIPNENCCDMTLFFGLMGTCSAVLVAPVGAFIVLTGQEKLEQLSKDVAICIVAKGLFQNVISDYLWAQAILLTSPTVTTAGLSLTIPAAMVSDLMLHGIQPTSMSILGAIMVLVGFLSFTNLDNSSGKDTAQKAKDADGGAHEAESSCQDEPSCSSSCVTKSAGVAAPQGDIRIRHSPCSGRKMAHSPRRRTSSFELSGIFDSESVAESTANIAVEMTAVTAVIPAAADEKWDDIASVNDVASAKSGRSIVAM